MRAHCLAVLAVAAVSSTAGAPSLASAEETSFRVIVHPSNPADEVTRRELSELFLKKTSRWPGGEAVHPVEPPEGSMTRAYFLSSVVGKSAFAVKMFWNRRVFEGRDVPPVEKRSDDEVVAYVRATPGAIGYVSPAAAVSGVKVLPISD
jgi:ABC-type phosphate transport system substrate-binding protein